MCLFHLSASFLQLHGMLERVCEDKVRMGPGSGFWQAQWIRTFLGGWCPCPVLNSPAPSAPAPSAPCSHHLCPPSAQLPSPLKSEMQQPLQDTNTQMLRKLLTLLL